MNKFPRKVVIVPCSGIGKSYGTVSRVAAYQVTDEDRPDQTQLIPLALLVMGDEDSERSWLKAQLSPLMAVNWPALPRWSSKAEGR